MASSPSAGTLSNKRSTWSVSHPRLLENGALGGATTAGPAPARQASGASHGDGEAPRQGPAAPRKPAATLGTPCTAASDGPRSTAPHGSRGPQKSQDASRIILGPKRPSAQRPPTRGPLRARPEMPWGDPGTVLPAGVGAPVAAPVAPVPPGEASLSLGRQGPRGPGSRFPVPGWHLHTVAVNVRAPCATFLRSRIYKNSFYFINLWSYPNVFIYL